MKRIIRWLFKTKQGAVLLFLAGVAVAAPFVQRATTAHKAERNKEQEPLAEVAERLRDQTLIDDYSEKRPTSPAKIARPTELDPSPRPVPPPPAEKLSSAKRLPVQIYAGDYGRLGQPLGGLAHPNPDHGVKLVSSQTRPEEEASAPFGRLLQCELTLTLESSKLDTPIVGLVTKDLWWNGKLIIPANSEVHGTARADRMRERIASTGVWTIVLAKGGPHLWGSELLLNGLALDMAADPDVAGAWDITDGSAGLRGKVLSAASSKEELSLFVATALAGAANGVIPRASNVFGQQYNLAGAETAFGQAAAAVADRYAERVLAKIAEEGWYTQVPAGKPFYLYVRQAILLGEARRGASLGVSPTGGAVPDPNENKTRVADPLADLIERAHAPRSQAPKAAAPVAAERPKAAPPKPVKPTMVDSSLFPKP